MGDRKWHSKEDQTKQISKSVFVTNFPDHICARDLWNICKDYGSVVDVYIPFKKSQANESPSQDPFCFYDLLHKKQEHDKGGNKLQSDDTLKYPPGFTPRESSETNSNSKHIVKERDNMGTQVDSEPTKVSQSPKEDGEMSACSGHFQKVTSVRSQVAKFLFAVEVK
ncbi:hypothetical protein CTI12_AA561260 [Artemisia annua]|uniref:RRM domain-containing protein n=1 Tax=Artemisia annua TaxID=35608 RepID=A0A2U1KV49_ARTAN|nr:hypothetical protein CTI12_AA561260 [Artemisia annua]